MAEEPKADQDLTVDDLIAFGRDYLAAVEDGDGIQLDKPMLVRFLTAALEALGRQRDQASKRRRSSGGRPRGGMGEMVMRYIANGLSESIALRITARAHGKSVEAVQRAYDSTSKKPPI